jgi:23S rRNA (pseudouridine1915-N3)-methyltransferase
VKVTLVCVGRPRAPLKAAIDNYEARLSHYFRFQALETKEGRPRGSQTATIVAAEGDRILALLPEQSEVVALHPGGTPWSSEELASHLAGAAVGGTPGLTFVIGGAHGLASAVLKRVDRLLSLSPMTFPHELARLILAEQLYRAGTINRGEPYHKG